MNDPLKSLEVEFLTRMWNLPSPSEAEHTYRMGCICGHCTTTRARAHSWMIDFKSRMARPDNG